MSVMTTAGLNQEVGRIAGAIYGDLAVWFEHPPLLLVPTVTFKVRRALEQIRDLRGLSPEQKDDLADDIRVSVVPLLFSLDIDAELIEEMAPIVRSAARRALEETV